MKRLKIQKGDKWAKVECIRAEIEETPDLMRRSDGSTYEIGTYSPHPIIVLRCECGKEITFEDDDAIHFPGKRNVLDCGECFSEEERRNSFSVMTAFSHPYRQRGKVDHKAREYRMSRSAMLAKLIDLGIEQLEKKESEKLV